MPEYGMRDEEHHIPSVPRMVPPVIPSRPNKRPLRHSLPIEDKLAAINRVHHGESKASVARHIGVPESTLRGWCKNETRLRSQAVGASSGKIPEAAVEDSTKIAFFEARNFNNNIQFDYSLRHQQTSSWIDNGYQFCQPTSYSNVVCPENITKRLKTTAVSCSTVTANSGNSLERSEIASPEPLPIEPSSQKNVLQVENQNLLEQQKQQQILKQYISWFHQQQPGLTQQHRQQQDLELGKQFVRRQNLENYLQEQYLRNVAVTQMQQHREEQQPAEEENVCGRVVHMQYEYNPNKHLWNKNKKSSRRFHKKVPVAERSFEKVSDDTSDSEKITLDKAIECGEKFLKYLESNDKTNISESSKMFVKNVLIHLKHE